MRSLQLFEKIIVTGALLGALAGLSSCGPKGNEPNVDLIQDMMESPALYAQSYDEDSPNHASMRVPPDHTAPVGFTPYKFKGDVDAASKNLQNPYAGNTSQEVLLTGQKYFETNCQVCHGQAGQGNPDSNVVKNMVLKPPSLCTDKVKAWPDGHIYHIITEGQGMMGPYASHIPQAYRWQVVSYVRHLQQEAKETK